MPTTHRPRVLMLILRFEVIFQLLALSNQVAEMSSAKGQWYILKKDDHGNALCATSSPDKVVSVTSKLECYKSCNIESCMCASGANFRKKQKRCEMYFDLPSDFQVDSDCTFYQSAEIQPTRGTCSRGFVAETTAISMNVPSQSPPTTVGWIVIQQRTYSSFNWELSWNTYKQGFGSFDSNFWLGLEKLHQLTKAKSYRLRVEVRLRSTGDWFSAEYSSFTVASEADKYRLNVSGYAGNAEDALNGPDPANNALFSTFDAHNDHRIYRNCAEYFNGGWWFRRCGRLSCLMCEEAQWGTEPRNSEVVNESRMMIMLN